MLSFETVLDQMEAEHRSTEEWSELRSRIRALVTNFVGRPQTDQAPSGV
ncbi:hypothetical protein [Streptomyces scabiei]|nr:hypothetical protein [Streptomyces scabiei]